MKEGEKILAKQGHPKINKFNDLMAQASIKSSLVGTALRLQFEAHDFINQGLERFKHSKFQEAYNFWSQALILYQKLKDKRAEGYTLGNLGSFHIAVGNYYEAIKCHERHLEISLEIEDFEEQASALGNLGCTYFSLGNFSKALNYIERSLELSVVTENSDKEKNSLSNLGAVYDRIGDYEKSIFYYKKSLEISRELEDSYGEGIALGNLGTAYLSLGDYESAKNMYEQRLAIARELKDLSGEGTALGNLGNVYLSIENYELAIQYHQKRLENARQLQDIQGEHIALGNLGYAYAQIEDYDRSIEFYQLSLAISRRIKDCHGEATVLNNLGSAFFQKGDLSLAEEALRDSIENHENMRCGLSDANQISIFETQTNPYILLQKLLVDQDEFQAALEISERGRVRAFIDLLNKQLSSHHSEKSTMGFYVIEEIKECAKKQNLVLVQYSIILDVELFIWVIQPTGDVDFRQVDLRPLKLQNTSLSTLVTEIYQSFNSDKAWDDGSIALGKESLSVAPFRKG